MGPTLSRLAPAGRPSPRKARTIVSPSAAPAEHARAAIDRDEEARRAVSAVLAGDRNAFAILVERELPGVTRVCYRVLGNREDADEAAQEAFVSAFRTLPAWRGDGPFGAWIARIALHIAYRRAHGTRAVTWIDSASLDGSDEILGAGQREVARHFRDAAVAAVTSDDPARILADGEQAALVREALRGLGEPYRETVTLRYFAGLSVPEIAEACDRPQGTVKTHLHRGLLRLRERLEAGGVAR